MDGLQGMMLFVPPAHAGQPHENEQRHGHHHEILHQANAQQPLLRSILSEKTIELSQEIDE
jgi:hypothetical protein